MDEHGVPMSVLNTANQDSNGVSHGASENPSLLHRFSELIVRYRWLFGLLSALFLVVSTSLCLAWFQAPDLRDPTMDFATINTDWSATMQQYLAMISETSDRPFRNLLHSVRSTSQRVDFNNTRGNRSPRELRPTQHNNRTSTSKGMSFCFGDSDPTLSLWKNYNGYSRIIVSLDDTPLSSASRKTDFFHFAAFLSLCRLEERILALKRYKEECIYVSQSPGHCCSVWSLPNMLRALVQVQSCELVVPHLRSLRDLLQSCTGPFRQGFLRRSCWDLHGSDPTRTCPQVRPVQCLTSPLIPFILATILPENDSDWHMVMLHLPLRRANTLLFYKDLEAFYSSGELTARLPWPLYIQGMYLHSYNELVSEFLRRDSFRLIVSCVLLSVLLALGSCSITVPLLALFGVFWSLLTAYTVYTQVLRIGHFSVLNFMAVILIIGLGTDDLLVYFQVWKSSDRELRVRPHQVVPGTPALIISDQGVSSHFLSIFKPTLYHERHHQTRRLHFTLLHAIPSMITTTLSTVIGLAVNFMSSIVAVQRFSLFAILAVLSNLTYVVVLAPVTFLIMDPVRCRLSKSCCHVWIFGSNRFSTIFSNLVICIRYFLMVIFLGLITFSVYEVFIAKSFSIPSSSEASTSFFSKSHPFELFLSGQSDQFWAERNLHYYSNLLRIHFVWGIQPNDDRTLWSFTHSADPPQWLPDVELDLNSVSSRKWIHWFCDTKLPQMPYLFLTEHTHTLPHPLTLHSFTLSQLIPDIRSPLLCPFGRFPQSLDTYIFAHACFNRTSHCCFSGQPLDIYSSSSHDFLRCLDEYLFSDHFSSGPFGTGYRFLSNRSDLSPVGLVVTALTNISLVNTSQSDTKQVVSRIHNWFHQTMVNIPDSLGLGHLVVPGLSALQITFNVTEYINWSIISAALMATILVLICSRNILLSILSFCSLSGCLLLTITLLSLLDNWQISLVEGLILSLAAGLAIDPCLHFALALSRRSPRQICSRQIAFHLRDIQHTLDMLTPAVTGSAWSTAVAGISMIGSNLLCYHQIGVFLATLMMIGWLFGFVLLASNLACVNSFYSYLCSRHT